jgi:hypothetical protein
MNTVALILAIVALGVSIAALVISLKKKETLIESQSDSNCNSNEVQLGGNQTLNPDPGNVTTIEQPYLPVDDIYVISEKKGGKS